MPRWVLIGAARPSGARRPGCSRRAEKHATAARARMAVGAGRNQFVNPRSDSSAATTANAAASKRPASGMYDMPSAAPISISPASGTANTGTKQQRPQVGRFGQTGRTDGLHQSLGHQ